MIRCKPADRYTALAMEKHKPGESQQCYKSYNSDYWTDDDANVWPPFRSLSWRERGLRRGSSELPFLVSPRLAEAVMVNAVDVAFTVTTANLVDVTKTVVCIMDKMGEDSGPPAVI